jgi:hypothetical protein
LSDRSSRVMDNFPIPKIAFPVQKIPYSNVQGISPQVAEFSAHFGNIGYCSRPVFILPEKCPTFLRLSRALVRLRRPKVALFRRRTANLNGWSPAASFRYPNLLVGDLVHERGDQTRVVQLFRLFRVSLSYQRRRSGLAAWANGGYGLLH